MKKELLLLLAGFAFPLLLNAQWTSQSTAFPTPDRGLFDISIPDANTVWGLAYSGTSGPSWHVNELTKTTDGGNSFTAFNFPINCGWGSISAIDALTAWVAVVHAPSYMDGAVYKTTDGGITWNEQGATTIFNSTSYANFIHFFNANDGIAGGDPNNGEFDLNITNDGGTTWAPVAGSLLPDPVSSEYGVFRNYCAIGDHFWFGTTKARIFHSADKGLTWSVINTGINMPSPYENIDFIFWTPDNGIARKYDAGSGTNIEVKVTDDGGATWSAVTVSGTFFGSAWGGIAYVPGTASTLISTGLHPNNSGSSYSNDGGITWTTIDNVPHYVCKFIDNTTGWSAGISIDSTNGGISKYTGVPLGYKNIETGKDVFFNVYPNPSNGNVLIQMANAGSQNILVTVSDFTGKNVFETQFEKPGEFFMQNIDLTVLPAGVYFLKLSCGEKSVTRKIILE